MGIQLNEIMFILLLQVTCCQLHEEKQPGNDNPRPRSPIIRIQIFTIQTLKQKECINSIFSTKLL